MQSTLEECREAHAHWIRMVLDQEPLGQHFVSFSFCRNLIKFLYILISYYL